MINREFETVGLYEHNADSYNTVKDTYDIGEDIVGIVHATGTGKSYNALQLAYDNKDRKIVYVVPSNGIIEHIKNIIDSNPNLDMERDFPNLEFRTYQSFISLSTEEISDIDCDLLILDEFHHIGAPVWGSRINTLIETHPDIKIFGMTAYTVRDRGTSYERDMANPDTDELFSGKIVSRYDLCDAMIDGVLPKPIYKSAYTNLIGLERNLEERVQKLDATPNEYKEYMKILSDAKKRIHEAPSIPNILKKSIKPNGKYIYFCPPLSEDGTNDIETVKKQAMEWLKTVTNKENIVFYTTTSDMGKDGKLNRKAFYDDVTLDGEKVDNKLRVMFAINQYNEGIHAPNIDGVIMGRGTTSDIVYFEQLGRALSVRGNTKEKFDELEKYSIEELTLMCKSKDIPVKENTSKEELIEKLIAPVVIDLANNYEFIKELENNLKDRIKEIQTNGLGNHRDIKISDASFDIEIENQNLFEMLMYVCDKLTDKWEIKYNYAKIYYEYYGNLDVPQGFRTNDGHSYDENGSINLGKWIIKQRAAYKRGELSSERKKLLVDIGMRFENIKNNIPWEDTYKYAKIYYEHYGNLEVPHKFRTNDGYTHNENGKISLGQWVTTQRIAFKEGTLSSERIRLLTDIGMRFENIKNNIPWEDTYKYAKIYYEYYGNLDVPQGFRTNDGYTHNENGKISLGQWVTTQRRAFKEGTLSSERKQLLDLIGMVYNVNDTEWQKKYEYAKKYYEHYGNLLIPCDFTTNDGYTYDKNGSINLGSWINNQRFELKKGKLSLERKKLLDSIGMVYRVNNDEWQKKYDYAKKYYEHYGNLLIPCDFTTNDGYTYDKNGSINLGSWINNQRFELKKGKLSLERKKLLDSIGMVYRVNNDEWQKKYEYAKKYYEHHGNLLISRDFTTNDGYTYDKNGRINLGWWISTQRQLYSSGKLSPERKQQLDSIGMVYNKNDVEWLEKYDYAKKYYEHHGNLLIPYGFTTNDGYIYDENGNINLGVWISLQRKNFNTGKLSSKRQSLLNAIGMIYDYDELEERWQKYFNYARIYYEYHGDLLIPHNFITSDGYTYNEKGGINLGSWLSDQKKKYKKGKLPQKRKELLDEIGMDWEPIKKVIPFEIMYNYARIYYEYHGNLEVPKGFRTNDGYTYDENGTVRLGQWISNQRNLTTPESERGKLLAKTGMRFENKNNTWEEWYKYAKIYHESYGNLEVPKGFRTNDGYTRDKNGTVSLGQWINNQRQAYSKGELSLERELMLTKIGMIWNIKKNKENVINICLEYNIDTIKNKSIIENISIQELKSKIEFLKAFNIKLVDENGLLIDIFSISSIDMKEKYNVSLEELINNYYVKDVQGKGV